MLGFSRFTPFPGVFVLRRQPSRRLSAAVSGGYLTARRGVESSQETRKQTQSKKKCLTGSESNFLEFHGFLTSVTRNFLTAFLEFYFFLLVITPSILMAFFRRPSFLQDLSWRHDFNNPGIIHHSHQPKFNFSSNQSINQSIFSLFFSFLTLSLDWLF